MTMTASDELTEAVSELRAVFPELRLGQLILNLASAAGVSDLGGVWDVEDEVLLVAARRLLERNRGRRPSAGTAPGPGTGLPVLNDGPTPLSRKTP
jgi:hypothetical protein